MTSNENIIPGFDDSYDKNLSVTLSTVDAVDHCISVHIKGSLEKVMMKMKKLGGDD